MHEQRKSGGEDRAVRGGEVVGGGVTMASKKWRTMGRIEEERGIEMGGLEGISGDNLKSP